MNFAGSAALAEVCNHRVLVVVAAFVLEIQKPLKSALGCMFSSDVSPRP